MAGHNIKIFTVKQNKTRAYYLFAFSRRYFNVDQCTNVILSNYNNFTI